ncbi:MAG: hypothetical protein JXR95_04580 [Deltaproteobacteria bacterium]|nr:hypothetical protein [Deltaproteobacteria bacterium]
MIKQGARETGIMGDGTGFRMCTACRARKGVKQETERSGNRKTEKQDTGNRETGKPAGYISVA